MEPNPIDQDVRETPKVEDGKNDNNLSDVSSVINRHKRKLDPSGDHDFKNDPKPSTSKSSPSNDDISFDPMPSTSSTKTEMEELLEKMSSSKTSSGDNKAESNNNEGPTTSNSHEYQSYNPFNFNFEYTPAPKKEYSSKEEYFDDLRKWLQQAYFWQSVTAGFPYYMMCQQLGQTPFQNDLSSHPTGGRVPVVNGRAVLPFLLRGLGPASRRNTPVIDGVECRIPSFWKRIAAEFIDFLILLIVKIMVTYVAVDFFHFVDMDTFDIFQKDVKLAYKTFMQITQDIVILEMIHRIVVCAFETFWLVSGPRGRTGGATPGKNLMGLRVLLCESTTAIEGTDRIVVRPGTSLGLGPAFLRALTKNFVLALLIPTSFAFIFFPHNRTGYDMICNSIVVEEPLLPHHEEED